MQNSVKTRNAIALLDASVLLVTLVISPSSVTAQWRPGDGRDVPAAVIAYTYLKTQNEASDQEVVCDGQVKDIFAKLRHSLDATGAHLLERLAFNEGAFIIQLEMVGARAGYEWPRRGSIQQPDSRKGDLLYVTTPIAALGQRVLVVVSSTAPEQTTVLTLDAELNADLVYDTSKRHVLEGETDAYPLGSTYQVRVLANNTLELEERAGSWLSGNEFPGVTRRIALRVSDGKVSLKVIPEASPKKR